MNLKLNLHCNTIALVVTALVFSPTTHAYQTSLGADPILITPQSTHRPACYLQTRNGQIIDLTTKCGFIKPSVCGTSLGSASRDAIVADFCRQNPRCLLTNTCNTMPRGINAPRPGTPMGFRLNDYPSSTSDETPLRLS
jgi:hypothetical protein